MYDLMKTLSVLDELDIDLEASHRFNARFVEVLPMLLDQIDLTGASE